MLLCHGSSSFSRRPGEGRDPYPAASMLRQLFDACFATTPSCGYGSRPSPGTTAVLLLAAQFFRLIIRSTDRLARSAMVGIDRHLLAKRQQAVQNVRERDALHVRAEIAGPQHFDVRQLGAYIVGHRAFRDHHEPPRPLLRAPS